MSARNRHSWIDGYVEQDGMLWRGWSRATRTSLTFKTRNEAVRWVLDRGQPEQKEKAS